MFPADVAKGLEQTWRSDETLNSDTPQEVIRKQQLVIDRFEPLKTVLDESLGPDDLILEAGCGSGRWIGHLNGSGYRCIGLDISPEIVSTMRRLSPDLRMLPGDVLVIPETWF